MAKKQNEEPVELLDIIGLSKEEQVIKLRDHYLNARNIWRNYPIEPRLKENINVLAEILEDYVAKVYNK